MRGKDLTLILLTLVRCLIKKKCVDKILMPVNLPSQPGLDKI